MTRWLDCSGHPVGVVGLGQPYAVPLRLHTGLDVELDQAARLLPLIGRGDDDQRAVQRGHQGIEGVLCHQGLVSG